MDIRIGKLCITDVPDALYSRVKQFVENPLYVVDRSAPNYKYGFRLELQGFLFYVFNRYEEPLITYDQFLDRLKKSIDAGLVVVTPVYSELSELLARVLCGITQILGADLVVKPVLSYSRLEDDVYRVAGLMRVGDKLYSIAENCAYKTAYVLICQMPNLAAQDLSKCYVVPYDSGVYYRGGLSHAKKYKILYVAKKLCKQMVTADDIKQHFDVCVKNKYLRFGDGWTLGDGTLTTARKLLKYCYLPRPLLHRFFVWYLFFRETLASPSDWMEHYLDKGVLLSKVSLLNGATVMLGRVKAVFRDIEWQGLLPLRMRINGMPIYTCDMKDVLLASYDFTSQSEFDNFLQEVSKTPLFLRRLLSDKLKVETVVRDDKQIVELSVTQSDNDTYNIEGVKCTLDDLAYIGYVSCQNAYYSNTNVLRACYLQKRDYSWLARLKKVIRKKAFEQYRAARQKAMALLQYLLDKYSEKLKLTRISGRKGVLVRGKKHTYFVDLKTGDVWLVNDHNALAELICVIEHVPEHSRFITYDRVVSRIVALLNDDIVSQYIRTLPR